MLKHKHHIIPKHAGGTDDPSNLVELTIEEHAQWHLARYYRYGQKQDLWACNILKGSVDISGELNPMWGRRGELNHMYGKKRPEHSAAMKGEGNPMYGQERSAETIYKIVTTIGDSRKGKNNSMYGKTRKDVTDRFTMQVTCPHCNKTGGSMPMKRWHFDNCKDKK